MLVHGQLALLLWACDGAGYHFDWSMGCSRCGSQDTGDGEKGLQTRHTPHSHTSSVPIPPAKPCGLRIVHSAMMSSKNYYIDKARALMIWLPLKSTPTERSTMCVLGRDVYFLMLRVSHAS